MDLSRYRQLFLDESTDHLTAMIEELGRPVQIEIDGGIGEGNAREVVEAGAEVLVAGSAVFGGGDPKGATQRLTAAARGAAG